MSPQSLGTREHLASWSKRIFFKPELYRARYDVPPRLQKTLGYAFYALTLDRKLNNGKDFFDSDDPIDGSVREELEGIVDKVTQARRRTIRMEWSWKEFLDGADQCRHDPDLLLQRFPPPPHMAQSPIDYPVSFVDRDGRLLYIYLPSLLSQTRVKTIFDAAAKVFRSQSSDFQKELGNNILEHEKVLPPNPTLQPGGLALFPAKGHSQHLPWEQHVPPSPTFSNPRHCHAAFDFLDSIDAETTGILGAVLALTSPNHLHVVYELFEALESRTLVPQDQQLFADIMQHWAFPFTDVYLHANAQLSDSYRTHYRPHTLQLYFSAGLSSENTLKVEGLHRQFTFGPGSIAIGYPAMFLSEMCPGGNDDQVMFAGCIDDLLRGTLTSVLHPLPLNDTEYNDYISHMLG
ncbi:hypothetical protein CC1G_02774 [Coprinopsis cinerea okayama7|uniref:Uncharacterized protein n=1 Tax=Coprinopsis cinerea (strain Okayama-7 / 130 / ATCC MYA-4618 / FGSC 9003) TaxID=240176 RepID=A8N004_COPC7|nr:hypothetical protein CC1G_02774 [Coprinopsis cinerea okayama7\|eukprot:XP_001828193.1 hypothetical protein CC1G_02774 [Coprinopsis cinerea okayama7\